MGLFDFLFRSVASVRATKFNGLNEFRHDEKPDVDPVTDVPDVTPIAIPEPVEPLHTEVAADALPQRFGTFLMIDLYPGDLRGKPDWAALERNSKIGKCEVVGAILKATEGISYRYTQWFVDNGKKLRNMWGSRLGRDRFMGAYHFIQVARSGAQQAEYFCRTMEKIGMPTFEQDIHPALDLEQGGQVNFIPTDCPKDAKGRYQLHKLPDNVKRDLAKRAMDTTRDCAERIREITGARPMLYGRGLMRDLGMTTARGYTQSQLRMSCYPVWNPAYTKTIVPMDAYGWPIKDVPLWQYGGDGVSAHPSLPNSVPGFGAVDLNVHIDGSRRTSLDSFRKALVVK